MAMIIQWIITYALVRFLVTLGVGVVTYGAVIVAITQAIGYAKAAYNGMPIHIINYLSIAGIPEFMGIICGAALARASLQFVKKLALIG